MIRAALMTRRRVTRTCAASSLYYKYTSQTYKRLYKHISNSLFLHLLVLIMYRIIPHIGHTPLKQHILYLKHANNRRKFYHSMPLHTNTANFAPSSNLQEILLAYKLNSNDPPFAHLFVLIIDEPISHIYTTQTSYFIPKTF